MTLNQKISEETKVYILAKDIDSKRKFEIKAKKDHFFGGHPTLQTVVSKTLRLFYNKFFVYKILVHRNNQPLPITTIQDKRGGHNYGPPPPPPFLFVKYPRPLRVSNPFVNQ